MEYLMNIKLADNLVYSEALDYALSLWQISQL